MSQTEQEESHPGGPKEKTLKIEKKKAGHTHYKLFSFMEILGYEFKSQPCS